MARILAALVLLLPASGGPRAPASSCEICHLTLAGRLLSPAVQWRGDVHSAAGVGCAACHGGDPESLENPKGRDHGFLGVLSPSRKTAVCGGCHADASAMSAFGLRVDQQVLYSAGAHGRALENGRGGPTCPDCHGAHGILPVDDPLSPASPVGSVATCSRCHEACGRPSDDKTAAGTSLPEGFRAGAHGKALLEARNSNAPSCPACHGAHATRAPSGRQSVTVCGSCHVVQKSFFDSGPHARALDVLGEPSCLSCHENHPQSRFDMRWTRERIGGLCQGCHPADSGPYNLGLALAGEIEDIDRMIGSNRELARLASLKGFEDEAANVILLEAHSWMRQAYTSLHSVDRRQVESLAGMASSRVQASRERISRHLLEIAIRRAGLGITALLFLAGAVLFWLKLEAVRSGQALEALLNEEEPENEGARE